MHHTRWEDAVSLMHQRGIRAAQTHERVGLADAIGRILAEDVYTLVPLPHYNSSAMDGYAVCGSGPWILKDAEEPSAHENRHRRTVDLQDGEAATILTGGLIPPGTTTVIRLEWVHLEEQDGSTLVVSDYGEPQPGSDMRNRGEELAEGSLAVSRGTRLGARHIAFLAVCGFDTVPVITQPTVSLAYTGNEVITEGIPGPGEVRDAYSAQFPAILSSMGAKVQGTARLHDDMDELRRWFQSDNCVASDVLVLTGGSSTSEVDLVRRLLSELDAHYIFEAVAVRPGHPCLAAELPDGRIVLGLPGNPLAAHTALYSYLPGYLAGVAGQNPPELLSLELTEDIPRFKKADARLIPARVTGEKARPFRRGVESHMLSAFAQAQALVVIPPEGAVAGERVQALPLTV